MLQLRFAPAASATAILGAALVAVLPFVGDPQETAAAGKAASATDPLLGSPLVIHGETIPFEAVRKAIVLGGPGTTVLELAKLRVWCDEEIARRVAGGAAAADFVVTDEDVEKAIQEQEEDLKNEYPNGDVKLADLVPEPEKLHERLKTIELFTRLFLPEDVTKFPQLTIDALASTDVGRQILEQMQKDGTRDPNPFMDGILFEMLHTYLQATSDITDGEDLPVDLALRINGKDVRVDELWPEVVPTLSEVDVRKAKQWIVNMRLLREDLEQAGLWLSDEVALAKYKEHTEPTKGEMFSQENIAVTFKRFPSLRSYREFRHAYDSFRQKIQPELTPENLKAFAERRTRALIGQSQIDVDVILLSAYDFKGQRWKPDGWAEARRRAQETAQAIAKDPSKWDAILDANSDFYDPPVPASMQNQQSLEQKNKGRFRGKTRNPLMSLLEESEYWSFLNGKTIADFVCFDQAVGTIANPIRGPYGYYIPRLLRRTPAPPSATLSEADLLDMADQDYSMCRMTEYAQELVRKNEVYGLD